MAGERTLPGLGLTGFWAEGSNGWKDGMDSNLRILSAATGGNVKSRTQSLPGTPTLGDIYIVQSSDPTNPNKIAIWDGEVGAEGWVYVDPTIGMSFYVVDESANVQWNGVAWGLIVAGGANSETLSVDTKTANYTLVLADSGSYVRMNVGAANTITVPPNASEAFEIGSVIQVRQVGVGQTTIVAGSGVTINSAETLKLRKAGSSASLVKVATDEWDLTGDLELVTP